MPAIANIVVADATPTDHTLVPITASMALSEWMEDAADTYEGNARVRASMSPPTSQRPTTRNKVDLFVPLEREVDGVTVVTDVIIFNLSHVIAKTCTSDEAAKAYAMFKNLVAHSTVESYLSARKPAY
jgi:hypothetical protein